MRENIKTPQTTLVIKKGDEAKAVMDALKRKPIILRDLKDLGKAMGVK